MQQHIGRRLGVYQIVERIGRGGMATVFKAYQPSVDRYVAIKILPSHLTEDESFVGRFTQEARTLARLEHPHILPVHDYGEQEGTTYLVMRYVEAGTLKDLIAREGPMELEEAAHVMDQVGRALDYAHSQDVVHRDIKPSNILIDQQGNTFLTDFGIAKLVAETAQFTASGAIIGTPAYMSPEQSMGQPVDYRCDIYSLGVVLYELVTGRVPFEAETPLAVLLKHINDPLPLPRQIKDDLPEAVERVILKAMAKTPGDRFQSARDMAGALARAVAPTPTEAVSPPVPAGAVEATTVAWSPDESVPPAVDAATPPSAMDRATPPPVVDTAPPASAVDTATPPPVVDRATPPPEVDTATPPPVVDGATPPPEVDTATPPPAVDTAAPAPVVDTATPAPDVSTAPPRLVTAAPAPGRKRWPLFAGGAALLVVLLAVVFVVWQPFGGEATPTAVGQAQPTPTAVSRPAIAPSAALAEQVQYPPDWTNYDNGNFVIALARHEETLWAGGDGGLVRWNLADRTYEKFGKAHGLASGRITDLLVDDAGILWIATDAGINSYDGQTFTTYSEADGLDALQIVALYLDGDGGLWAGSRNGERGLNYYDGEAWSAPPVPPLPVEYRNVLALGGNEQVPLFVVVEDQGVALYDGETWTVVTSADGLPSDEIMDALLTGDALWVSSDGGLGRFDLDTREVETFPHTGIYGMHQLSGGMIWFRGLGHALRYDPDTGDWQEFETEPGTLPGGQVTDPVEDENRLWWGTYGDGVTLYDGSQWETWQTDEKLGGNFIEAIRQDRDGVLWFLHPGTGLTRHEPAGDTWQVFAQADGALDWPGIHDVDSDGTVWIGEFGALLRYDAQGWQTFPAPELTDVEIYAIEIGPGDVKWIMTDGGLMRHDPASDEWTMFTAADHPLIEGAPSLLATSDGTLWLGGEEGLVSYDGRRWSTPGAAAEAPQYVGDLAEAPDGSLWAAVGDQLAHLVDGQWSYSAGPSDAWLETVAVGPDGHVWAGGEGLGRYDPATGEWPFYTPSDGLVHRLVRAIHVTPEGVVWVGTEGGVSRYVPPD